MTKEEVELRGVKDSLQDTQPVGAIINQCKTLDQVNAGKISLLLIEYYNNFTTRWKIKMLCIILTDNIRVQFV